MFTQGVDVVELDTALTLLAHGLFAAVITDPATQTQVIMAQSRPGVPLIAPTRCKPKREYGKGFNLCVSPLVKQ